MIKSLQLVNGFVVIFDTEDFDKIKQHTWHLSRSHYSNYARSRPNNSTSIMMHRLIMDCPTDLYVDHINGDGLDNRKANLRICTMQQNNAYRKFNKKIGKYKGASFVSSSGRWRSQIMVNRKKINLGYYATQEEAASAYNEGALKYFGKFAYLNTIGELAL